MPPCTASRAGRTSTHGSTMHTIAVKGNGMMRAASTGGFRRGSLPSLSGKCHGDTRRRSRRATLAHLHVVTPQVEPIQTSAAQQVPCPLRPGATVRIGDRLFNIAAALGRGSFGSVWAASGKGLGQVAVKEIVCNTPGDLVNAIYEAKILDNLVRQLPAIVACSLPGLIAREVASTGPEQWQVRLAMTRLPGVSLAEYLKASSHPRRSSHHEASSLAAYLKASSHHEGFGEFSIHLAEACKLSRELLAQLSSALKYISDFVYHRDINPQNIMIDDRFGCPRFGLIDFGLATDSAKWRMDVSSGVAPGDTGVVRLHRCAAVGNGCFWPPSSWLAFSNGPEELSQHSELRFEFAECLDFHAVGLVAMKVVAGCLRLRAGQQGIHSEREIAKGKWDVLDGGIGRTCEDTIVSKFFALQEAWACYWHSVTTWWQRVIKTSRQGRSHDIEALRRSLVRLGVHKVVQRDLSNLCSALQKASAACLVAPAHLGLSEVPALLDTIVVMISGAVKKPSISPSWRKVLSNVGNSRMQSPAGKKTNTPESFHKPRCTKQPRQQSPPIGPFTYLKPTHGSVSSSTGTPPSSSARSRSSPPSSAVVSMS